MRAALLIALAVMTAGCLRDPPRQRAFAPGLEAANAAYDKALIAGDAAALEELLTGDYTLIDDHGGVAGKAQQIRTMTQDIDLLEATSDEVKIIPLGIDSALITGRFSGRFQANGTQRNFIERYSSVWIHRGGKWRLRHEHASMVPQGPVKNAD